MPETQASHSLAAGADGPFGLAADFVLGVLSTRERTVVMELRASDAAFDAVVRDLERMFAPLLLQVPAVAPPDGLQHRILAQVFDLRDDHRAGFRPLPEEAVLRPVRRSLGRWRGVAATGWLAAVLLAIALAITLAADARRAGQHYVAVLSPDGGTPGFAVSLDLGAGQLWVKRTGIGAPDQKAYELWAISSARGAPVSLGQINSTLKVPLTMLAGTGYTLLSEMQLAVSLEPAGGSPTGQPTGPVVFSGRLYPSGE